MTGKSEMSAGQASSGKKQVMSGGKNNNNNRYRKERHRNKHLIQTARRDKEEVERGEVEE